jgi:FkbM family methyltransferase
MSYLESIFVENIKKDNVKVILELGSFNLEDAIKLHNYYEARVYSFECNPDSLAKCHKTLSQMNEKCLKNIKLIEKAVSLENKPVSFYSFDINKYNAPGSSSLLKIDFSKRNIEDPDYNRENPQKEIIVEGIRLDNFLEEEKIDNVDLLCIDLQGYELNALKSLGDKIIDVKYIITECSIQCTYENGSNFKELNDYLKTYGFSYICSNRFNYNFPDLNIKGFSEFDALFIKI